MQGRRSWSLLWSVFPRVGSDSLESPKLAKIPSATKGRSRLVPDINRAPVRARFCQLMKTGHRAYDPNWLGSDSGWITGYSKATRSVERMGHSPLTRRCGSIMEAIPLLAVCSCRDV